MRRFRFHGRSLLLLALASGCSTYHAFDSNADLRSKFVERLGTESATRTGIPFELGSALSTRVDQEIRPAAEEKRRIDQVLDYIFSRLDLKYELAPTRDAQAAFRDRRANCLSFVNLFIGIARHERLNPFYVEVTDYQRWAFRDGTVVSQGHIVAGLYVDGKLQTYDFLPYKAKGYRGFHPIDDLTAAAHFYNNLGAEALLEGDIGRARPLLQLASDLAPRFVKAINNLGVAWSRGGDPGRAEAVLRRGLAIDAADVAILTNLAAVCARQGRAQEATELLSRIQGVNNTNPFFFIYQAEQALGRGDAAAALQSMTEALRRDSDAPEVQLGFVKVYIALGDLEKARHFLTRAIQLDATNPEARRFAQMLFPEKQ